MDFELSQNTQNDSNINRSLEILCRELPSSKVEGTAKIQLKNRYFEQEKGYKLSKKSASIIVQRSQENIPGTICWNVSRRRDFGVAPDFVYS